MVIGHHGDLEAGSRGIPWLLAQETRGLAGGRGFLVDDCGDDSWKADWVWGDCGVIGCDRCSIAITKLEAPVHLWAEAVRVSRQRQASFYKH